MLTAWRLKCLDPAGHDLMGRAVEAVVGRPLTLVEPSGDADPLPFGEHHGVIDEIAEGHHVDEDRVLGVPPTDGKAQRRHPVACACRPLLRPAGETAGHLDLVDHIGRCRRLLADTEQGVEGVRGDYEAAAEGHSVKLPGADAFVCLSPGDTQQCGSLLDGVSEPVVHRTLLQSGPE